MKLTMKSLTMSMKNRYSFIEHNNPFPVSVEPEIANVSIAEKPSMFGKEWNYKNIQSHCIETIGQWNRFTW